MGDTEQLPTVITMCAGYAGIERGLELAGVQHRVLSYVEIEAYCIANLVAKMESRQLVPAPVYTDLKTFPAHLFRGATDLLTAGYPCQPFSQVGRRAGSEDPRHLWPYIREHIRTMRPVRCFFENVEGHISLGLSTVLSDLEDDGYKATWGIFSAEEEGAPHRRKRVYIMADSQRPGLERHPEDVFRVNKPGRNKANTKGSSATGSVLRRKSRPWPAEPGLGRMADGTPDFVDRIRLLGNGVVPKTAARAWEVLSARLAGDEEKAVDRAIEIVSGMAIGENK